jgi:hypothetical protein
MDLNIFSSHFSRSCTRALRFYLDLERTSQLAPYSDMSEAITRLHLVSRSVDVSYKQYFEACAPLTCTIQVTHADRERASWLPCNLHTHTYMYTHMYAFAPSPSSKSVLRTLAGARLEICQCCFFSLSFFFPKIYTGKNHFTREKTIFFACTGEAVPLRRPDRVAGRDRRRQDRHRHYPRAGAILINSFIFIL